MDSTHLPSYITATQLESIPIPQGFEQQFLPAHYLVSTTGAAPPSYPNACLSDLEESSSFANKQCQNRMLGFISSGYQETSNWQSSTSDAPTKYMFSGIGSFPASQPNHITHGLASQNAGHLEMDSYWSLCSEPVFKEQPELMCSTIHPVTSANNVLQSVSGRKDDIDLPPPLCHSQGIVSLDGIETVISLNNAWRSVDGSTNLVDNEAGEGFLESFLPSNPGFSDRSARFSSSSEESGCIQTLQPSLLEKRTQETLNRTKMQCCPPIRVEEVQNIKEEPVQNLEDAHRWNGKAEHDTELKPDQQLVSSEMASNLQDQSLHGQTAKMSQSSGGKGDQGAQSESCNNSKKKRKTTREDQRPAVKELLSTLKATSQELKETEADDEKEVKRCKASLVDEGKECDKISKSIKREQSYMSDNSTTTCEKQVKEAGEKPAAEVIPPKQDYIHVRARRGQATDSHSLAERVRREKISERMKLLQNLVPNCNKVTGKALMLDEIINYVQSLQLQVEFLSMKLAAISPRFNFNIDNYNYFPSEILSAHMAPASSMVQIPEVSNLSQHLFTESPTREPYMTATSNIRSQDQVLEVHIAAGLMSYMGW